MTTKNSFVIHFSFLGKKYRSTVKAKNVIEAREVFRKALLSKLVVDSIEAEEDESFEESTLDFLRSVFGMK